MAPPTIPLPIELRLRALEDFVTACKANEPLEQKAQTDETARIHKRIDEIESRHTRIFWILVSGLGASAVQFVINGGLNLVHR